MKNKAKKSDGKRTHPYRRYFQEVYSAVFFVSILFHLGRINRCDCSCVLANRIALCSPLNIKIHLEAQQLKYPNVEGYFISQYLKLDIWEWLRRAYLT